LRLLLDSHLLIWAVAEPARLRPREREAIGDPVTDVFVSAATVWELGIKSALGRLELPEPLSVTLGRLAFTPLAITVLHAEEAASLPRLHADPFDRMLVAQARLESLTLVTHDAAVRAYPGVSFLD